ncbi:MAG: hypothetical protein JWM74_6323, partial [Myxococcaceae bacterium]|nr:hypothetical protein [Myxococcaceae bacterium]
KPRVTSVKAPPTSPTKTIAKPAAAKSLAPVAKTVPAAQPSKTVIAKAKSTKTGKPSKAVAVEKPPEKTLSPDTIITMGCAGFPVPATRYFKEFLFLEVQETHVTLPGTGTIRRWRREAPEGFKFAMLAPREIGQEGFREGKVIESALKSLAEVGKELDARTAVFVAPPEFTTGRANRAAVKDFLIAVKKMFDRVVWEPPPSWDPDDAGALAAEAGAIATRDPLAHGPTSEPIAYYRLPGPAGHKSRYEDPAIERLAEIARVAKNTDATYVFTNVDMFADAKRFKKSMKL